MTLDCLVTMWHDPTMQMTELTVIALANKHIREGTARDIRRRAGVTQAQMAAEVGGVDESTISRWENGNRKPRGDAAERWLHALGKLAAIEQSGTSEAA
jgi:DNA-binding transcriptional regulator YiaG